MSYAGFLFGNVNEKGELDDGLDRETHDGLNMLMNQGIFGLGSLGIEENDVVDKDDGKGVNATTRRGDVPVLEKAADAVDYEDEDEAADDEDTAKSEAYYKRAVASFGSSSSTTTSTSSVPSLSSFATANRNKKDQDNYDDDEDTIAPPPSNTSSRPPIIMTPAPSMPQPSKPKPSATSTTSSTPSIKITDYVSGEDDDDDDDNDTPQPTIKKRRVATSSSRPSALVLAVQSLLNVMNQRSSLPPVHGHLGVSSLPQEARFICSGLKAPGNPILKFSEIFTTRPPQPEPRRTKKVRVQPPVAVVREDDLEGDEETWFKHFGGHTRPEDDSGTYEDDEGNDDGEEKDDTEAGQDSSANDEQPLARPPSPEPIHAGDVSMEEAPRSELGAVPLKDKAEKEDRAGFEVFSDTVFHAIEQGNWESDIAWDPLPAETQQSPHTTKQSHNNNTQYSDAGAFRYPKDYLDEVFDTPADTPSSSVPHSSTTTSTPSSSSSSYSYTSSSGAYSSAPHADSTSSNGTSSRPSSSSSSSTSTDKPSLSLVGLTWSLFPIKNTDLEQGVWVQDVVWDDRTVKPGVTAPLILDFNDKNMLFGEFLDPALLDPVAAQIKLAEAEAAAAATAAAAANTNKRKGGKRKAPTPAATPAATASTIARDAPSEDKDNFNLSNDRFYRRSASRTPKEPPKKATVQHAVPALKLSMVRTALTPEDLRSLHRPRAVFPVRQRFRIVPMTKENKKAGSSRGGEQSMKHKADLSAKTGRVVLTEYIEEHPPLVQNVGMASRVRTFYRKKSPQDMPNPTYEDGDAMSLGASDESPFLGEIAPGRSVQSIVNNLYKAPIHKHDVPSTDFLLVRSGRRFIIREIDATYTAGQEQPMTEVPAPNSRLANTYIKNRLAAFLFRQFLKKNNPFRRVRIQDILEAFPSQSEAAVRKRLKDVSDYQRGGEDSGCWTLKGDMSPTEEDLRKLVTPEYACAYEAMLVGHQRLIDTGLVRLTTPDALSQVLQTMSETDQARKKCEYVEAELQATPWNQTSNFIAAAQHKMKLQLTPFSKDEDGGVSTTHVTSAGNPQLGKDLFSYVKMPQKEQNKKQRQLKAALPKTSVTGTSADLRKLSLEEAAGVLRSFGVTEDEINRLSRWKRIGLVREMSSKAALGGGGETKFARGMRFSLDQQTQRYKENAQTIFDAQLKMIGLTEHEMEELDNEEQFADFGKDLEELLGAEKAEKSKGKKAAPRPRATSSFFAAEAAEAEEAAVFQRMMAGKASGAGPSTKGGMTFAHNEVPPPFPRNAPSAAPMMPHVTPPSTPLDEFSTSLPSTPAIVTPSLTEYDSSEEGLNGNANSNGSTAGLSAPSGTSSANKKTVVRRTVTKKNPDGTFSKVVEIIRDPAQIAALINRKNRVNVPVPGRVSGTGGGRVISEEAERQERMRREKARLESEFHALTMLNTQLSGEQLPVAKGPAEQRRCGSCNLLGHTRSSPACPLYSITHDLAPTPLLSSVTSPIRTVQELGLYRFNGTVFRIKNEIRKVTPCPENPFRIVVKGLNLANLTTKKRRRNGEDDDDDDLEVLTSPRIQSRAPRQRIGRTGRGADVEFNGIVEKVLDYMRKVPTAEVFTRPVPKTIAPDYYDVILNPICFADMREKARRIEYRNKNHFLDDVRLLVNNCREYNLGKHLASNPGLPTTAEGVYHVVLTELDKHQEDLVVLEEALMRQSTGMNPLGSSTAGGSVPGTPRSPFAVPTSPFFLNQSSVPTSPVSISSPLPHGDNAHPLGYSIPGYSSSHTSNDDVNMSPVQMQTPKIEEDEDVIVDV